MIWFQNSCNLESIKDWKDDYLESSVTQRGRSFAENPGAFPSFQVPFRQSLRIRPFFFFILFLCPSLSPSRLFSRHFLNPHDPVRDEVRDYRLVDPSRPRDRRKIPSYHLKSSPIWESYSPRGIPILCHVGGESTAATCTSSSAAVPSILRAVYVTCLLRQL